MDSSDKKAKNQNYRNIILVIVFSLLAGTLIKIPELFGYHIFEPSSMLFYYKNIGLMILPFVAGFFIIKNKLNWKIIAAIVGIFIAVTAAVDFYPSYSPNNTEFLSGIHLLILLWLVTGVAYSGHEWRTSRYFAKKIEFIRLKIWQTFYLYIYAAWMAVVVFVFPVIFGFR